MITEDELKNWGVPDIQEAFPNNLKIVINSNGVVGQNLVSYGISEEEGVKFGVIDSRTKKAIFEMDFSFPGSNHLGFEQKVIELESIAVLDKEYAKKGIATYYLTKLQEYGIANKYKNIVLCVNSGADIFKNLDRELIINSEILKDFYDKTNNQCIPFEFLE